MIVSVIGAGVVAQMVVGAETLRGIKAFPKKARHSVRPRVGTGVACPLARKQIKRKHG